MKSLSAFLTVLFGSVAAFGLIVACIAWFHLHDVSAPYGVLLIFGTLGVSGVVFMRLSHETAARKAIPWKRAALYVLATVAVIFGILTFFFLLLGQKDAVSAFGTLIPFGIPGIGLIAYLALTERDGGNTASIGAAVQGETK